MMHRLMDLTSRQLLQFGFVKVIKFVSYKVRMVLFSIRFQSQEQNKNSLQKKKKKEKKDGPVSYSLGTVSLVFEIPKIF